MTSKCIEHWDRLRPTVLSPAISAPTIPVPMWTRDTGIACQNCRKSHVRCATEPGFSDCQRCDSRGLACEPVPKKVRSVVQSSASPGLQERLYQFRLPRPLAPRRIPVSPRHGNLQRKLYQHEVVPCTASGQEEQISGGLDLSTPAATSVPRGYASELKHSDRSQRSTTQDPSVGPSFEKRGKQTSGCNNSSIIPKYLDVSRERVRQLLEGYLRHNHALYPIFHKQRLEEHFRSFARRYDHRLNPEQLQPSNCLSATIALLVLAVGEICMQNESKLASDSNLTRNTHEVNGVYHSAPSGISERNSLHATTRLLADTRSRASMVDIELSSDLPNTRTPFHSVELPENKDGSAVSGSLYFEKAKQIWKLARSGDDLQVAQVHILAGLCAAHHAGIQAGSICIKYAGDKLFDLLNEHNLLVDDGDYRILERLQNPLSTGEPIYVAVKAAWTCLRLETAGSMIGEFTPSRLRGAGALPLPFTLVGVMDQQVIVRDYNLATIAVEKILHSLRNRCVAKQIHLSTWQQIHDQVEGCRGDLQHWKTTLPPYLVWVNEDDVRLNVFKARLRAKYHETLFHIYLPFLEYTLNIWSRPADDSNMTAVVGTGCSTLGSTSKVQIFSTIDTRNVDGILEAWALCLDAATLSIISCLRFIKSGDLLRGQDVAYAAFEMVTALFAVYRSNPLRSYVDFRSLEVPYIHAIKILECVGTHYELSREACSNLKEMWFRTRDSQPQTFTHTNDL